MSKVKPTTHDPAMFEPETLDPPAEEWLEFGAAIERGDVETVRRFLADRQLPVGLAGPLSMIKPEAKRLQAIIDADVPQAEIDAAEILRNMMQQSHPRTVEDAEAIGQRLAVLTVELASMKGRRDAAVYAAEQLAGLRNVFSELFDGTAGKKACGTLSPTLGNALRGAGFDAQALYEKPWQEAFRLQPNTTPSPRKRLRAVK